MFVWQGWPHALVPCSLAQLFRMHCYCSRDALKLLLMLGLHAPQQAMIAAISDRGLCLLVSCTLVRVMLASFQDEGRRESRCFTSRCEARTVSRCCRFSAAPLSSSRPRRFSPAGSDKQLTHCQVAMHFCRGYGCWWHDTRRLTVATLSFLPLPPLI